VNTVTNLRGISSPAERVLVSQDGHYSMDLVMFQEHSGMQPVQPETGFL
jgi:hypothetical protein